MRAEKVVAVATIEKVSNVAALTPDPSPASGRGEGFFFFVFDMVSDVTLSVTLSASERITAP